MQEVSKGKMLTAADSGSPGTARCHGSPRCTTAASCACPAHSSTRRRRSQVVQLSACKTQCVPHLDAVLALIDLANERVLKAARVVRHLSPVQSEPHLEQCGLPLLLRVTHESLRRKQGGTIASALWLPAKCTNAGYTHQWASVCCARRRDPSSGARTFSMSSRCTYCSGALCMHASRKSLIS